MYVYVYTFYAQVAGLIFLIHLFWFELNNKHNNCLLFVIIIIIILRFAKFKFELKFLVNDFSRIITYLYFGDLWVAARFDSCCTEDT